MGPIWGRQDPGGPHDGPMNFIIWVISGSKEDPCVYHAMLECSFDACVMNYSRYRYGLQAGMSFEEGFGEMIFF